MHATSLSALPYQSCSEFVKVTPRRENGANPPSASPPESSLCPASPTFAALMAVWDSLHQAPIVEKL
jgi:hypothetical protein